MGTQLNIEERQNKGEIKRQNEREVYIHIHNERERKREREIKSHDERKIMS